MVLIVVGGVRSHERGYGPFAPRVDGQVITEHVHAGMTKKDVLRLLGPPHEEHAPPAGSNEGPLWGYHIKEFGATAPDNPVFIQFDATGAVAQKWTH